MNMTSLVDPTIIDSMRALAKSGETVAALVECLCSALKIEVNDSSSNFGCALGGRTGGREMAQQSRPGQGGRRHESLRNSSPGKSKQASLVHGVNNEKGFECI
jgi:hypothetical protein